MNMTAPASIAALVATLLAASTSLAQSKLVAVRDGGPMSDAREPEAPPQPAQPYAAPFLGRGVSPVTAVRFETMNAPFTKDGGAAVATTFLLGGSYRLTDNVAVNLRLGVDRVALQGVDAKAGFLNPQVGAQYQWRLGRSVRLGASFFAAIPLGFGGGNAGDPDLVAAHKAAALSRGAMENAMFAVNDLTFGYGLDVAYVDHGLTAQLGAGIATGLRARGDEVQPDTFKANATFGLSVGYFLIPRLSLGAELRFQSYVSTPSSVEKDPSTRRNLSAGGGLRGHFPISAGAWMRPGVSYGHGILGPVEASGYHMIQVDLPVTF